MGCSSEFRPRKALHGPRPVPLQVRRDSATTRKPRPPPVIIYISSPEPIHATPEEFMSLVQRLTGLPKNSDPTCPPVETSGCREKTSTAGETGRAIERTSLLPSMQDPVANDCTFSSLSSDAVLIDVLHDFSPEYQVETGDFGDRSLGGTTSIWRHLIFPGESNVDVFDDFFNF